MRDVAKTGDDSTFDGGRALSVKHSVIAMCCAALSCRAAALQRGRA